MQTRIIIPLTELEYVALSQMAKEDCRNPRGQILFLLRQEARKRGLVSDPEAATQPENQESAIHATNK